MRSSTFRSLFKFFYLLLTWKQLIKFLCAIALVVTLAMILKVDENYDYSFDPEHPKKSLNESVTADKLLKMDERKVFINDTIPTRLLNREEEDLKPRKNLILLSSSLPRSGSSFIGELLSSVPGSIYFFEPDNWLEKSCSLESCYSRLLAEIFTCSFNDSYINFMMKRWQFFSFLNDDVKVCQGLTGRAMQGCLRSFDLLAMCRAATTIVIKTIRLRLSWIQRDLSKFPSHLKVILLTRDPRAIRLSTSKFGWVKDTESLCRALEDDLNTYTAFRANFSGGVKQITYERFCSDIAGNTKGILSFLGFADIPESTQTYLKNHTEYHGPKLGVMSTLSDSAKSHSKWRETIPIQVLYDVERLQTCRSVISQLNFTIFGSTARVRNFSIPLFKREVH